MSVEIAGAVAAGLAGYLVLGLVFALAFVWRWVAKIDPAARGMPLAARLLIVPGAAVLWPLLLWKRFTQTSPPVS